MKKLFVLFISVFVMMSLDLTAFAENTAKVYADEVSAKQGKTISIPVKIKENKGLMGFKISLEYSADVIKIESVSKGTVTKNGNFNHNNGLNDGSVSVIWNNVEDVKDDGTLFVIDVFIKNELQHNEKIKLTYSQPDTFNEKWQDVYLDCNDIVLLSENHTSEQHTSEQSDSDDNTSIKQSDYNHNTSVNEQSDSRDNTSVTKPNIDDKYVVDTVISSLEQHGYSSLEQASSDEEFLNELKKKSETLFSDYENIKKNYNKSYQNEFVKKVISSIDNKNITAAVEKAMSENNIKKIESGSGSKDFVEDVQNELKKYSDNVPEIASEQSVDEAYKTIEKLYDTSKGENGFSIYKTAIIIFCIILIIVFVFAVIMLKMKRSGNRSKQ